MRRRLSRRKRRIQEQASSRGDEPPDPFSLATATLIAAGLGTATAVATPFINKSLQPKPPKLGSTTTPLAGEDTTLKPGQKTNAINTTPQGVLSQASTGRGTLLGG